jgi:hypothetical protein
LIFAAVTELGFNCRLPTLFLGRPAATARPPRAMNRAKHEITFAARSGRSQYAAPVPALLRVHDDCAMGAV